MLKFCIYWVVCGIIITTTYLIAKAIVVRSTITNDDDWDQFSSMWSKSFCSGWPEFDDSKFIGKILTYGEIALLIAVWPYAILIFELSCRRTLKQFQENSEAEKEP